MSDGEPRFWTYMGRAAAVLTVVFALGATIATAWEAHQKNLTFFQALPIVFGVSVDSTEPPVEPPPPPVDLRPIQPPVPPPPQKNVPENPEGPGQSLIDEEHADRTKPPEGGPLPPTPKRGPGIVTPDSKKQNPPPVEGENPWNKPHNESFKGEQEQTGQTPPPANRDDGTPLSPDPDTDPERLTGANPFTSTRSDRSNEAKGKKLVGLL